MIDIIRQERNLGYISLFTRSGLAIKTFNVTIALVASNFVYYQVKYLLCILTSERVLHTPFAGRNHVFEAKTTYSVFFRH